MIEYNLLIGKNKKLEAPTRFELVMRVLQTRALPLGDGAMRHNLRYSQSIIVITEFVNCNHTLFDSTLLLYMKKKKIATYFQ